MKTELKPIGQRSRHAGFTLLETVFAVFIIAMLAAVAMPKLITPGTMTLHSQAQAAADAVRRAQGQAVARGQRTRVTVVAGSSGSVRIAPCTTAPTPVCTDDASATVTVAQGVTMGALSSALFFDSLGQPVTAATAGSPLTTNTTFTLSHTTGSGTGSTRTFTVTVAPTTGRVTVTP